MPPTAAQLGTVTYRQIIQTARDELGVFNDRERHPDRILLSQLETAQRTYLRELADLLKDRISASRLLASKLSGGVLTGVDAAGNPYTVSAGDGYAVFVGGDTVPFVGGSAISVDPASTGFVLPVDSMQIIDIYATLTLNYRQPVRWLEQREVAKVTSTFNELYAVVVGWRLVPIKNPLDHKTLWDDVLSLTISWIPEAPVLDVTDPATLDELSVIPSIYSNALASHLSAFMAAREQTFDPNFPASYVSLYQQMAQDDRKSLLLLSAKDHRFIKTRRTTRNR